MIVWALILVDVDFSGNWQVVDVVILATEWNEDDVGNWLLTLGSEFAAYVPLFKDNNITGKRLLRLTEEKVKTLGVSSMGHRDDIVAEIESLKK